MRRDRPEAPAFMGQSKVEYMEECLERLEEAHGSAEEYLRWLGLRTEELEALRNKLVQGA